jgi:omega-amidase
MQQELKLTLIQQPIVWQNSEANRFFFEGLILEHQTKSDVYILPEMFTTGFSMNIGQIAEPENGSTLIWMKKLAAKKGAVIAGSVAVKENEHFFNRFYWVEPSGKTEFYDKRHLFRMADEDKVYSPGKAQKIIKYLGWRIMPQVCYDLRFPVFCRNTQRLNYDLLLFVANWPAARSQAWYDLLKARAIENLSFVIGVNRIGQDGNQIVYDGKSAAFDYKGLDISNIKPSEAILKTVTFNKKELNDFREKFPAWMDADNFSLI